MKVHKCDGDGKVGHALVKVIFMRDNLIFECNKKGRAIADLPFIMQNAKAQS
jgi:hypothetical protein